MIERDLVNVFDVALFRPVRSGPGGDLGTPTTIAEDLCAIYEPSSDVFKDVDGLETFLVGKFWIDPVDNDGVAIDIREDDFLSYTDFKGSLQTEQTIRRVSPWYCGAELDHLLLEIGRR